MPNDDDITWNWPDNTFGCVQRAASFDSPRLGSTYGFGIYLPPSYDHDTQRRYPVVYWLHGYTSRPHYAGYFTERLDAAIRKGRAPEMIVVAVNGLYSSLFCDDHSGHRPVESVIIQELIPHIDTHYRTLPERSGRLLEGFSRGGFGAAHLAFKYPELFGALSLLAGAFHSRTDLEHVRPTIFHGYFGGDPALWRAENSFDLACHAADTIRGRLPIRMIVGDADKGQYPGNLRYHQHLTTLGFTPELTVIPGVDHTVRGIYDHFPGNPFAFFNSL
jgi:enterochelin esterase-like enzyme